MKRCDFYITEEHSGKLEEIKSYGFSKSFIIRRALDLLFAGDTIKKLKGALDVQETDKETV